MHLYISTLQQRACYIPCPDTNLHYRTAPVSWTFTVHLDQAVGWGAGKADKGGVQAGEAGLQQRCSQLETALLQGLQQVCTLCDSFHFIPYSLGCGASCDSSDILTWKHRCMWSATLYRLIPHNLFKWHAYCMLLLWVFQGMLSLAWTWPMGWLRFTWKGCSLSQHRMLHSTAGTAHAWIPPECKACSLLHGCKADTESGSNFK